MGHMDTDKKIHVGRWIWWACYAAVGGKRSRAPEKLGMSWQTVKNYAAADVPEKLPVDALPNLEMRLKLPPGHIRAAYLKEPRPAPLVDRRGRRPEDGESKVRVRTSISSKLFERVMRQADARNLALDAVIVEALGDWAASQEGSGEVIPPAGKTRFSKRLSPADHK